MTSPAEPGSRFGGRGGERYVVRTVVGAGAQGSVYDVSDSRLNRTAAAKVALDAGEESDELRAQFEHELQIASRFGHPRILQVFDAGELEDGAPWLVMEWMAGGSLNGVLERFAPRGRRLPLRYVKYYAICVAEALQAVHGEGLTHMDVKPANVMLTGRGEAKLGDFGVSRQADVRADKAVGTLGYMAPEQLRGASGHSIDLFGCGVLMFVLLTGRLPRQGERAGVPDGRIREEEFAELPDGFGDLIRLCVSQDAEGRPDSAEQLLVSLKAIDARGDTRDGLASGEELPPVPPGGLRAAPTTADTSLVFEFSSEEDEEVALLPPGRTRSLPVRSTEQVVDGATRVADVGWSAWTDKQARGPVALVLAVLVLLGVGFAVAWTFRPPAGADVRDLLDSCQSHVLQGSGAEWTHEALGQVTLEIDPVGQLLLACQELSRGDYGAASSWASESRPEDDWTRARKHWTLAVTAQLGPARDYAAAGLHYLKVTSACAGEGCAELVPAATVGLTSACLVLEYATEACRNVEQIRSARTLGMLKSVVLEADGLHQPAWTALRYALALPRDEASDPCAELDALQTWSGTALVEALRKPVQEALEGTSCDSFGGAAVAPIEEAEAPTAAD